ncbi:MAG: N-6 DNA methylase [Bacteroidota bacterium]
MNNDFFKYLKSYSSDPQDVNRIIVSIFLSGRKILFCRNKLINGFIIQKGDQDYKDFNEIKEKYQISSFEDLIEAFEFVISPEEKTVTGAVYTPEIIREYIINEVIQTGSSIDNSYKICDPACGCSGFLLSAARRIKQLTKRSFKEIFRDNLYGLDIQAYSIKRSEILLALFAILEGEDETDFEFNFHVGNALEFNWDSKIKQFDGFHAVVGNPPYVCSRNIDERSMNLIYNWSVSQTGHPDLYIPFFEIGMKALKSGGKLGYITMNTFFKSVNGRALREYFEEKRFKMDILDFDTLQVFQTRSTYTCICVIQKSISSCINYSRISNINSLVSEGFQFQKIPYTSLNYLNGWNLQKIEILNKIERVGTPFGKKYTTRNGVATLKNDVYIFDPVEEDEDYLFLENGQLYPIEKDICVDIVNPNKLTKFDSIDPLRKKIIFPYWVIKGTPTVIPEPELKSSFPQAYNYLLDKRSVLAERDKGKGKDYPVWYSFGRNQSLDAYPFKLLFPHISPSIPNYIINDEPNLLFVNGLAVVGDSKRELELLQKIMSSRLFWFYVSNSSKPYGSGYYSMSRNYIKNFGVFDFSEDQIDYILSLSQSSELDVYLEKLYEVDLNEKVENVEVLSLTDSL